MNIFASEVFDNMDAVIYCKGNLKHQFMMVQGDSCVKHKF